MRIWFWTNYLNLLVIFLSFWAKQAGANPLLLGDWSAVDSSGYPEKKIYLSVTSPTEAWKTVIQGEEVYEMKAISIKPISEFELELDGKLYDLQIITWKMKLCLKGSRSCLNFKKMEGRYVFVPSVHYIPEKQQKIVIESEDLSSSTGQTFRFEKPLDVSAMYPDRTAEDQFGKDSVIEIESPNQDFKVRLKMKFFYTNANSSFGKSPDDFSYVIEKEWLDPKSGALIFSEFEEGEGLPRFWLEDPNGNLDINFDFVEI